MKYFVVAVAVLALSAGVSFLMGWLAAFNDERDPPRQ